MIATSLNGGESQSANLSFVDQNSFLACPNGHLPTSEKDARIADTLSLWGSTTSERFIGSRVSHLCVKPMLTPDKSIDVGDQRGEELELA